MITEQRLLEIAEEMRIELEWWQKEIIFDRITKRYCVNCGRKKGKTTGSQFRTAMRLMNGEVPGAGLIGGIAITSEEFKAAKQILAGVKTILTADGWRFSKEEVRMSEEKKIAYATTSEVKLPNMSRAMAFPTGTSGDNMRPWTFHEIVSDEADFQNPEIFQATAPCLARFDGVELLQSTPNKLGDRTTHFARAFFGITPGYKVYHIPSADEKGRSTSVHISQSWLDDYAKTHSRREYEREILAQFSSDISGAFPKAVLDDCYSENIEWRADTAFIGAKYASFDVQDSVIAENFYRDGISYIRIGVIPEYGRRIMETENEIVNIVHSNGAVSRIIIDSTSLGITPIESMAQLVGPGLVTGVSNHETHDEIEGSRKRYMKEDLYVNALKLMERGLVKWSDRRITEAFMGVKHDYAKKSKRIYIVGNDIADAIVRALFPVWGRKEWHGPVKKEHFFSVKF